MKLGTLREAVDITRDYAVAENEAGVNLTPPHLARHTRSFQFLMGVGVQSKKSKSADVSRRQDSAEMETNVALSMLKRQALHQ